MNFGEVAGHLKYTTPEEVWYLQKSAQENSAVIVTVHGPFLHFLMINDEGDIIDEYPETPKFRGK